MVTTYGTIDTLVNNPPAEPKEGAPAEIPTTTVTVSFAEPHSGSATLVVPTASTGGLAAGKVRVILDAA